MSEKKAKAMRRQTRLLWPRQGERVLSCAHGFSTNDAEVFAFVKPVRFRGHGDLEKARFYLLCKPCVKLRAAGANVTSLLATVGAWKNPDPIVIPLAPLPEAG